MNKFLWFFLSFSCAILSLPFILWGTLIGMELKIAGAHNTLLNMVIGFIVSLVVDLIIFIICVYTQPIQKNKQDLSFDI